MENNLQMHSLGIQLDVDLFFFLKWGLWRKEINNKWENSLRRDYLCTKNSWFVSDIQKNTHIELQESFPVEK